MSFSDGRAEHQANTERQLPPRSRTPRRGLAPTLEAGRWCPQTPRARPKGIRGGSLGWHGPRTQGEGGCGPQTELSPEPAGLAAKCPSKQKCHVPGIKQIADISVLRQRNYSSRRHRPRQALSLSLENCHLNRTWGFWRWVTWPRPRVPLPEGSVHSAEGTALRMPRPSPTR